MQHVRYSCSRHDLRSVVPFPRDEVKGKIRCEVPRSLPRFQRHRSGSSPFVLGSSQASTPRVLRENGRLGPFTRLRARAEGWNQQHHAAYVLPSLSPSLLVKSYLTSLVLKTCEERCILYFYFIYNGVGVGAFLPHTLVAFGNIVGPPLTALDGLILHQTVLVQNNSGSDIPFQDSGCLFETK